jgi:hypothetical protein
MRMTFTQEEGLHLGGLTREFFYLLVEQMLSPQWGMFKVVCNRFHWFSEAPLSPKEEPQTQRQYTVLGTIVGMAVYNQVVLPIRFPLVFYKKLLKKPIGLADIAEIDPDLASSLQAVLDTKRQGGCF